MAQRSGSPESVRGGLDASPQAVFRGEKRELSNAVRLQVTCGACGFQQVHVEPWPAGWSDGVRTELYLDWELRMNKTVTIAEEALEKAHEAAHPNCDGEVFGRLEFQRL